MAVRGRRPKPTALRLVEGNAEHRPLPENEPAPEGAPVKPRWLKGRGAALWDEVLRFASSWLTCADSYKLAAWCDRQADFEQPTKRGAWTAADRREHRSAGSELGLDPTSRARMGSTRDGKKDDPARKYFGRTA